MTKLIPPNVSPGDWEATPRDRMVRAAIEDKIPLEDYPYAIWVPSPPFALGALGALVAKTDGIGMHGTPEANALLMSKAKRLAEALADLVRTMDVWSESFPSTFGANPQCVVYPQGAKTYERARAALIEAGWREVEG